MKKYELLNNFSDQIEEKHNITQEDNSNIWDNARIFGNALLLNSAKDKTWIFDDETIDARIFGNANM